MINSTTHDNIPSYEPLTQKLVTSVNENGKTVYVLETYSIEEMNDGSEKYITVFQEYKQFLLRLIDIQVMHRILSSDALGLQAVQDYKNALHLTVDFSPGFTFPSPPKINNVPYQAFFETLPLDKDISYVKNKLGVTIL
jgi:hypothetical protein